jgi:hypothetical protein
MPITTNVVSSNPVHQLLMTGRWFSPGSPVSSINKTDRHDIVEILLKVALNTINQTRANKKQTNKQINERTNLNLGKIK